MFQKKLPFFFRVLFSLILFYFLYHFLLKEQIHKSFTEEQSKTIQFHYRYFVYASLLHCLINYLKAIRFKIIASQLRIPLRDIIKAQFSGILLNWIYTRLGDLFRIAYFYQKHHSSILQSSSRILMERILDFKFILCLAVITFSHFHLFEIPRFAYGMIFIVFILSIPLSYFLSQNVYYIHVFIKAFILLSPQKIKSWLLKKEIFILNQLKWKGKWSQLIVSEILTLFFWFSEALLIWFILKSIGSQASYGIAICIVIASVLSFFIPTLPGSFVVYESSIIFILQKTGDWGNILFISLYIHLFYLTLSTITGIPALTFIEIKLKGILKSIRNIFSNHLNIFF